MRIRAFYVSRFKSLFQVTIGPLSELTVIVGGNDSGKSNLLEALRIYFQWFPIQPSQDFPEAIPDDFWWDTDPSQPIQLFAVLELSEAERQKIPSMPDVVICGLEIVMADKQIKWASPNEEVTKVLIPSVAKGKDGEEGPVVVSDIALLHSLAEMLRQDFTFVPSARDRPASPNSIIRQPLVDEQTLNAWRQMAQPWQPRQRRPFEEFTEEALTVLTHWDGFEVRQNEPILGRGVKATHLKDTGGGSQSVLRIITDVRSPAGILAVEEPENHLHPGLVKKLIHDLRISRKQVILTTHSPFVIDANRIEEIWWAYRPERETQLTNLKSLNELWSVLQLIGLRNSDFLYANVLLLVEGDADRAFYMTILAERGVGPADILVFPMNSGDKAEYSVDAWVEQFRFRKDLPFLAVDRDAEKRARNATNKHKIPRNRLFVAQDDLEDLYSEERLLNSCQELFSEIVDQEELKKNLARGKRKKFLRERLKGQRHWREDLAKDIASGSPDSDLPPTLSEFIERLKQEVAVSQVGT